jgi:hypothetical protein
VEVSEGKLCRLAAAFAISNMGQEVPKDIAKAPFGHGPYVSAEGQVDQFAGHLMETDEHEDIFHGEAQMWYGDLGKRSNEEILRVHGAHCPWIKQILDAPEA